MSDANFISVNVIVTNSEESGSQKRIKDILKEYTDYTDEEIDSITGYMDDSPEKKEANNNSASMIKHLGINAAKQFATTTTNAFIGGLQQKAAYSGNTANANALNNTLSAVNEGISRVSNVAQWATAGFSVHWAVGLVTTAIGLGLEVYDLTMDNKAEIAEMKWELQNQVMEADKKARRLGIISSSRGRATTNYKM